MRSIHSSVVEEMKAKETQDGVEMKLLEFGDGVSGE